MKICYLYTFSDVLHTCYVCVLKSCLTKVIKTVSCGIGAETAVLNDAWMLKGKLKHCFHYINIIVLKTVGSETEPGTLKYERSAMVIHRLRAPCVV